jgi:hypothetical protein
MTGLTGMCLCSRTCIRGLTSPRPTQPEKKRWAQDRIERDKPRASEIWRNGGGVDASFDWRQHSPGAHSELLKLGIDAVTMAESICLLNVVAHSYKSTWATTFTDLRDRWSRYESYGLSRETSSMITETYDTDRSFSLDSWSAFHEVLGRFLGAVRPALE